MSVVGFSPSDAARIGETVRRVEKMPGNYVRGRRSNVTPPDRALLRGKLDEELEAGQTVKMTVWRWNGSSDEETEEKVDVYDWLLKSDQTIASDKKVVAAYFRDSGRWYVIAAECG